MNSKIIKAFIGLIAAFILVIAVFGILPQLGMKGPFENFQNPLAGLFEGGKNAAANAALDVSGLKSKAESAIPIASPRPRACPPPRWTPPSTRWTSKAGR